MASKNMNSRLSIVIVNYKQEVLTSECVNSILKSSFSDYHVIIVDNESSQASVQTLRKSCPSATVIPTDRNLGYGGGNNLGIRYALQSGSALILLLNNDTVVDRDLLRLLVESADLHPKAGAIGASIYYYDDREVLWYGGGRLEVDKALGAHIGIGARNVSLGTDVVDTDFVTGCCLLTTRTVLEDIGLLDEKYFLYLEDADFCARAKDAGYQVLYNPNAKLYHKVSNSTNRESPTYIYFNLRNKILFLRKHSRPSRWILRLPYLAYFYTRQLTRLTLKHHDFRAARAALWGLKDGLANYTGELGEGRLNRL